VCVGGGAGGGVCLCVRESVYTERTKQDQSPKPHTLETKP